MIVTTAKNHTAAIVVSPQLNVHAWFTRAKFCHRSHSAIISDFLCFPHEPYVLRIATLPKSNVLSIITITRLTLGEAATELLK